MAGIRMSGLISNMDTESVVKAMMDAHRLKLTKIENKKTVLEWKQDKWKDLNTKLYKLYQEQTTKLRLTSNYNVNKATSANESVVKVTADKNAATGSHSIAVKELASSQYVTGGPISITDFSKAKKLTDAGFKEGDIIKITNGTKIVELNIDNNTTVNNFLTSCTNAGLNASYDAAQKRFFISSKNSGTDNAFTITSGSYTSEGSAAREGVVSLIDTSSSSISAMNEALVKLKQGGNTEDEEKLLIDLAKKKVNTEATNKANRFYYEVAKKETSLTDEEVKQIEEKYSNIDDETEKNNKINAEKNEKLEQKIKEKLQSDDYKTKISEAIKNGITQSVVTDELGINDESEVALYTFKSEDDRTKQAENDMKSAITKFKDAYTVGKGDNSYTEDNSPLKNLGLGEIRDVSSDLSPTTPGGYTLISAKNSKVIYNGVELENSSNTISVNGLTFEAISVSEKDDKGNYKSTSLTVTKDTQGIYDMVKEFVTQYNSILKDMNTLYYANSAKGYDPLTDEEKEAMSDEQIKLWEDKIKDSSLRRDSTLGSITSAMKSAMASTIELEINGEKKRYSLSSFGIMTAKDYTEKGLLHIYGDKEDSTYSDKDDKLKKAIEEDPDTFIKVMTGITENLHTAMNKKMSKTSLSSALTFYNDKQITDQLTQYKKDISKMESKLEEKEAAYYKQFTAMEKALASLQEQQSALSGLLGTS